MQNSHEENSNKIYDLNKINSKIINYLKSGYSREVLIHLSFILTCKDDTKDVTQSFIVKEVDEARIYKRNSKEPSNKNIHIENEKLYSEYLQQIRRLF